MAPLRRFATRVLTFFRPQHADRELDREIVSHLALMEDDFMRKGMTGDEARAAARRATGGVEQAKELHRDARSFNWLEETRRDLRYAARTLVKYPGFSITAILSIAIGVGANVAIFTAVDALLLRSAPIADPESVVSVYTGTPEAPFSAASYPNFVDLRDAGVLGDLAAFSAIAVSFSDGDTTDVLPGTIVSGNYFDLLGVRAALGRTFRPDEDRIGTPLRVVVLSHAFWQSRFGSTGTIVGRELTLNGAPYTVIGVAPAVFSDPVITPTAAPAFWVPMAAQADVRPPSAGLRRQLGGFDLLHARSARWISMVGRLKPGTTVEHASAALAVASNRLHDYPENNRALRAIVVPLGEGKGAKTEFRPLLGLLSAAACLVLLLVCANVAGLVIARLDGRRREIAIRMSIGASRWRLVRQSLTESIVIGFLGGLGGLLIASWSPSLWAILRLPSSIRLEINWRVVLFGLGVAIGSGVLTGLVGVLQIVRRLASQLHSTTRTLSGAEASARLRRALVVVQVGVSLVLLVGAGLFLRTLQNAYSVNLGYVTDRMLAVDLNVDVRGYAPAVGQEVYRRTLEGLAALPGVQAVGAARVAVLSGNARTTRVGTSPSSRDDVNQMAARTNIVTDKYFDVFGVPLLRGRSFGAADTAKSPAVAIISRSLAVRLWPGAEPVGRHMFVGDVELSVIGVVPDVAYSNALERGAPPLFYAPLSQNYEGALTLHVRTTTDDPMTILPLVRQVVRDIDDRLVVTNARTLADDFYGSMRLRRLVATTVGLFGVLALALAAIGLYGLMSYAVGRRTQEIGVRLALGAERSSIVAMVLRDGARLVWWGSAGGLLVAFASTRVLDSWLFGVTPSDPLTFAIVCGVLVGVGVLACAGPAIRALRISPLVALRSE